MAEKSRADQLRAQILGLVKEYHQEAFPPKPFLGGISTIPVSGKVFDNHELELLVDSSLDFWLTTGRYAEQFEKSFAKVMGMKHAMLCNSGSSANLLAVTALTSSRLGKRALKEGDEVITAAAGFPTTVNPILQNRLTPVFVDIQLGNLRKLLAGRRMTLDLDSKAKEWLAERGYDPIYGARPLKRAIQTNLQNTLAEMILRGEIPDGASILATTNKEGIVFKIDAGGKGSQKTAA